MSEIFFDSLIVDWVREAFKYGPLNPFEWRCAQRLFSLNQVDFESSKTFSSSSQAFMVSNLRMSMTIAISGPSAEKKTFGRLLVWS